MPATDLEICARIRAILASHWIDTERLRFRTTAGTVRFYGVLSRQGSFAVCKLGTAFLETLTDEIQRTPGVNKVYFTGVQIERVKQTKGTPERGNGAVLACDEGRPREETKEPVEAAPQAQGAS